MKDQSKLPTTATITRTPFPKSKKIFVKGSLHNISVAMREIETDDEVEIKNGSIRKEKMKITVYDTSGPYTDPLSDIDVTAGLKTLRENWIRKRNDVEQLSDLSSHFANARLSDPRQSSINFRNIRKPLRAKSGANVSQMHYARKGIIT